MANTKSAQQHVLINKRNRQRNLAQRAGIKALFKQLSKLNDKAELDKQLSLIYKTLDRASMQAMHPNKANRLKARAVRIIRAKQAA